MIEVGDRVRVWDRREWGTPYRARSQRTWDFKHWVGTVRRVVGPITCDCEAAYGFGECAGCVRTPYYQIAVALPKPHDQTAHDSYYRVCPIADRAWQMRRAGVALELIERARRRKVAPQLELFA